MDSDSKDSAAERVEGNSLTPEQIEEIMADAKLSPTELLRKEFNKYESQANRNKSSSNIIPSRSSNLTYKFVKILIIFLIIIGIIYGAYIYFSEMRNSSHKQLEEKQALSKLIAKYSAIDDWRDNLEKLDDVYSIDVENALIRKDNLPLLISGYIQDIVTRDGKHYIYFSEVGSPSPEIIFILEYDSDQTEQLIKQLHENNEFTLIASITSVQKSDNALFDSDLSDKFLANGRCVELLNVGY